MPKKIETPQPASEAAERKTAEAWAELRTTPAWLFAAARAYHGWPIGQELTAAEFDAAVEATASIPIGG